MLKPLRQTSSNVLFPRLLASALTIIASTLLIANAASAQPLSEQEWTDVDQSIARATNWIISKQQSDGSFPTIPQGQPAITSFGVLSLLAQGEMPGSGQHGESLTQAIEYVLSTQKPSGLLANVGPRTKKLTRNVSHQVGQTCVYNHAISALMLAEAYATTNTDLTEKMRKSIERALEVTLSEQRRPRWRKIDQGGWRYLDRFDSSDADLSVIGWQLMFLRSAKNSGFDVPAKAIDDAVACVQRHFSKKQQKFLYYPAGLRGTRAMTGAGILAFSHAGMHDAPEIKQAGKLLRSFSFANYNTPEGGLDRYHYSLFQCTQAAYQLGGEHWQHFHAPAFRTLLRNQNPNGSWAPERTNHGDSQYGSVYTTALVVLSLSAPNQLLPIFQR